MGRRDHRWKRFGFQFLRKVLGNCSGYVKGKRRCTRYWVEEKPVHVLLETLAWELKGV